MRGERLNEQLRARVEREKTAYDEDELWAQHNRLQRRFSHVFYCPNAEAGQAHFWDAVRRYSPGATVLDYGCYQGGVSRDILPFGPKKLVGIDISEKGLELARERLGARADLHIMDGHAMSFADESFDLVVGSSILHHLDFERAVSEVARVLKPGGHAIFGEPLRDNPAGKLLRMMTPNARTADEQPLSRGQIVWADRTMGGRSEHAFVSLVSVPVGMLTSLVLKSPDNPPTRVADKLDRAIATTPAKYWMRRVILVWQKRA